MAEEKATHVFEEGLHMSGQLGIHTLALQTGADPEKFEGYMTGEAFPTAAEAPGSVSRGGQSTIKSQHLLKSGNESESEATEYLWLVKSSGVFSADLFARVFDRMYEEVREKLEG